VTLRTAPRFVALLAWAGLLCSASDAFELEHPPPEWRGVWVLDRDAGASAVSALDPAQARALLGTKLSVDGGAPALGALPCPSPSFQVSSESKENFTVDFRIDPGAVGIVSEPIRILQVDCPNYAYNLIPLAADRGLVIYQGHFFGAAKHGSR
jgi:hypothetical protein